MGKHYDMNLSWVGRGFGEPLVLAMLTNALVDNGVNAAWTPKGKTRDWMVTCPVFNRNEDTASLSFGGRYVCNDVPIIIQHIETLEKMLGCEIDFTYDHVPVRFEEISVPSVDILMCTETGYYTPYKNWPYFDELKALLSKEGITYADIHKDKLWGMLCLNYAKRCKLYLGLDTGVSHYVSKFVNGKALIIQSGYVSSYFWAYQYNFQFIELGLPCSPCYISRRSISKDIYCKRNNVCMTAISARDVLKEMLLLL